MPKGTTIKNGKYEGRYVREADGDKLLISKGCLSFELPVSFVEEILATSWEMDSLERVARYAGVTS